jgi:chromosome segregation ATPase
MTSATDTDIREIKTAVESIAKATEANSKAIADLTTSVTGLREEMRVGFSDIRGEIRQVETKLEGEIKEVRGKIDTSEAKLVGKIDKLDERTRLGFWGFVGRGLVLAILIALIPFVTRYLTSSLPEIFQP